MKGKQQIPTKKRQFLLPDGLKPHLDSFVERLSKKGYTELTIEGYYSSISHFGVWLNKKIDSN